MSEGRLFVAFLLMMASMFACIVLAERRNRGVGRWLLAGVVFGPLAVIALLTRSTASEVVS